MLTKFSLSDGFLPSFSENPCPQHGDLVNIRLSEDLQIVQQQDGTMKEMIVDTYFQMDYSTGKWQRSKKFRPKKPS
jgi:negative elongation factor A